MKRLTSLALTVPVTMLCLAMGSVDSTSAEAPPSKRVALPSEWRDALLIVANHRADLGTIPTGGAFRIGVLELEEDGGPVRVVVRAGETVAATFESAGAAAWVDRRIDLACYAGTACSVTFETEQGCWAGPLELVGPTPEAPPNVLVFLIDTLRADHLGCYGYARNTSPHIDVFAKEAVKFTHLVASSSWTRPSVATLLTGTQPNRHGGQGFHDVLREGLPWLPAGLGTQGYECQGFVSNPNVLPRWGFGPGFCRYVDINSKKWKKTETPDKDVVDAVLPAIEHAMGRPWFFFVHTIGPHMPYAPPEDFAARFQPPAYEGTEEEQHHARQIDLYDGEIAFTDAQFQRLVDQLKTLGAYENTLILVLADHGEEFWDHGGVSHAQTLYEEVIRVPLLVKLPGPSQPPHTIPHLVEMADIAPTVMDLLHLPADPAFQGTSFAVMFRDNNPLKQVATASLRTPRHSLDAVQTSSSKYIRDRRENEEMWFDLDEDPKEEASAPVPPPEGEPLDLISKALAMEEAYGFHLAILGDPEQPVKIKGALEGDVRGRYEWLFLGGPSEATRRGDHIELVCDMSWLHRFKRPISLGPLRIDRRLAHFHLPAHPNSRFALTLTQDGQPLPADAIHLGATGKTAPLQGERLLAEDLLAPPQGILPDPLPDGTNVYLWFVSPIEPAKHEELAPDMREALEAMGYF